MNISPLERCAGLVFGFLFHGGRSQRVSDETLAEHLGDTHDWTWLHLALADHRARRFLEHFTDMPQETRELMLSQEDRIQLHLTPKGAWGLLPDIEKDFADQSLGPGRLVFWFDAGHLITARHHPVRALSWVVGSEFYYGAKKHALDRAAARELARGRFELFHGW